MKRRIRAGSLGWGSLSWGLTLALASTAHAESEPAPGSGSGGSLPLPSQSGSHWVNFRAGRVEILEAPDGSQRFCFSRGAQVTVDRYRLEGKNLELQQSPSGLKLTGPGWIAFCPCPHPPVSLGFSKALAAPPSDLLVKDPTLRLGGVPVFWLPYLWVRSPERVGALPPEVAWRGADGLLLVSGVHVPWRNRRTGKRGSLDLRGGAYLKGGAVLEAAYVGPNTRALGRWDHLQQSLLELEMEGAHPERSGGAVAFRVEAIQGPRGRRGTLDLEPAARAFDRAELGFIKPLPEFVIGVGARGDAIRGNPLGAGVAVGPFAHLGLARVLGGASTLGGAVDVASTRDSELGATTWVNARTTLAWGTRPGPWAVNLQLGQRTFLTIGEQRESGGAALSARGEVRLPLARPWGPGDDPWVHRVEPYLRIDGEVSRISRWPAVPSPGSGELAGAQMGVRSALGKRHARGGFSLVAAGGWISHRPQGQMFGNAEPQASSWGRAFAGGKVLGHAQLLALRAECYALQPARASAAQLTESSEPGFVFLGKVRLGAPRSPWLGGAVEGRQAVEPTVVRFLTADGADWLRSGWFSSSGYSAGGEFGIPWTRYLATLANLNIDLRKSDILSLRGTVAYRHPCGCLALTGSAGHRLGREGIDAWVSIELAP